MLSLFATKAIVVVAMFLVAFLSMSLPGLFFSRLTGAGGQLSRRSRVTLNSLSCFAAGVFLATLFLDLMLDTQESFDALHKRWSLQSDFPLANFTVVLGFILIMIFEQMGLSLFSGAAPANDDERRAGAASSSNTSPRTSTPKPRYGAADDSTSETSPPVRESSIRDDAMVEIVTPRGDALRAILLISVLSFHSIFEGVAIGFQKTASQTLRIFGALSIHKCLVAFSLGLPLANPSAQRHLSSSSRLLLRLIFSVASPIGIGFGIIIDLMEQSAATAIVTAGLQAIACGTFLFVVFVEARSSLLSIDISARVRLAWLCRWRRTLAWSHVDYRTGERRA